MTPPADSMQTALDAAVSAAVGRAESVVAQARAATVAGAPPLDLAPLYEAVRRLLDAVAALDPEQGAALAPRIFSLRDQLDGLSTELEERYGAGRDHADSAKPAPAVVHRHGRRRD